MKALGPIPAGFEADGDGRLSIGGVSVNAPWITLRVDGRRYCVDLQAERVDRKTLERRAGA